MRKLNKLVAALMLATLTVFSACTEKEVPVPTVNTERLDALRAELRNLQMQVYGAEKNMEEGKANQESIEVQIAALKTEIERLNNSYLEEVDYGVTVIDFQNNKLANATVKLAQDGEVVSLTTDEDGYVIFPAMYSGVVNGVIEAEGYATANFMTSLNDNESEGVEFRNSRVALFPTGNNDKGMFTLTGNLYANYSTINDTLNQGENPAGPNPDQPRVNYDKVTDKTLSFSLFTFGGDGWLVNNNDAFINVMSVVYEDAAYTASFNANGTYTVKLPARSVFEGSNDFNENFTWVIDAQDFQANYTYGSEENSVTESRFYEFGRKVVEGFGERIQPGETRTRDYYYNSASKN
jgi:DNA-binding FrmR family transcriptional regulator